MKLIVAESCQAFKLAIFEECFLFHSATVKVFMTQTTSSPHRAVDCSRLTSLSISWRQGYEAPMSRITPNLSVLGDWSEFRHGDGEQMRRTW